MAEYHKYSIKKNRFLRSFTTGFEIKDDKLFCERDTYRRIFVCDPIDGIESGALWGRFHGEWELDEDMVVTVYAAASDLQSILWQEEEKQIGDLLKGQELTCDEKLHLLRSLGSVFTVNQSDFLLYELEGRYLYLLMEVKGIGEGEIRNLYVNNQEDFFLDTFPEIYQEYGGFFHRYLSVFSSIYLDFQEKIDSVANLLDIDTAPAELLPVFCGWMGLDVSGDFLQEERLRILTKEAYQLNRTKGTKETLLRVCEIVLGEVPVILEKNVFREYTQAEDDELYEGLYGKGMFDVTLLIPTYVPEHQRSQLMFLLNQFTPVRTRLKLKFLDQKGSMDGHVYMDMNAEVMDTRTVALDERVGLDGNIMLKE